jgi:hypothetical protein
MEQREKTGTQTEWEALSQEVMEDRRRYKRVPLAFPIEVSGFGRTGRLFTECTTTSNISKTGCRFLLKTQVSRGDVVAIKVLSRREDHSPASKPLLFQIICVVPEEEGWSVGALQLQPENLWHMAFPQNNPSKPSAE